MGTKLKVQDSVVAEWTNAPPGYAEEFNEIMNNHTREYMDILVEACGRGQNEQGINQSTVTPSTLPAATSLVEFESEQRFKEKVVAQALCESAVSGVYVFVGNNGKRYLMAKDHDVTIPKKTHLGGLGGGEYKSDDGLVDHTLAYSFSLGDQTLIEL